MLALLAPMVFGQDASPKDAKEIIQQSVQRDLLNFERLKNYTYVEHDEDKTFDRRGKIKKTERETYEVMILGGHDYERLIERDDKPLSSKEARKEEDKLDKEVERRKHESEADKAKIAKERQEQRKFLDEVPEEFNFQLLGVEQVMASRHVAFLARAEDRVSTEGSGREADSEHARQSVDRPRRVSVGESGS